MRTGVYIKEIAFLQILAAGIQNGFLQIANGSGIIANNGNIAGRGREAGQRSVHGTSTLMIEQNLEAQFCAVEFTVDAVICHDAGINLAKCSEAVLAKIYLGAASGMVGRILRILHIFRVGDAETVQKSLHPAFDGEEVHFITVGSHAQDLRFVGKTVFTLEVCAAQFVETDIFVAVIIVSCQDLQHGRQDRCTHDGSILAQRVENLDAVTQGRICRQTDLVVIRRANKGVGDDFVHAKITADCASETAGLLDLRITAATGVAGGELGRDLIISVEAGNFLCDVRIVSHIASP